MATVPASSRHEQRGARARAGPRRDEGPVLVTDPLGEVRRRESGDELPTPRVACTSPATPGVPASVASTVAPVSWRRRASPMRAARRRGRRTRRHQAAPAAGDRRVGEPRGRVEGEGGAEDREQTAARSSAPDGETSATRGRPGRVRSRTTPRRPLPRRRTRRPRARRWCPRSRGSAAATAPGPAAHLRDRRPVAAALSTMAASVPVTTTATSITRPVAPSSDWTRTTGRWPTRSASVPRRGGDGVGDGEGAGAEPAEAVSCRSLGDEEERAELAHGQREAPDERHEDVGGAGDRQESSVGGERSHEGSFGCVGTTRRTHLQGHVEPSAVPILGVPSHQVGSSRLTVVVRRVRCGGVECCSARARAQGRRRVRRWW